MLKACGFSLTPQRRKCLLKIKDAENREATTPDEWLLTRALTMSDSGISFALKAKYTSHSGAGTCSSNTSSLFFRC